MLEARCRQCGKVFRYYLANGPGHFCSRACADRGRYGTAEERFWKRVEKTDTCWNWTGSLRQGYGHLRLKDARHTSISAHRFSWELHLGPIPDGYLVCHHCDNPRCVRPDHLFIGLPRHNTQDMIRKGHSKLDPHCQHLKGMEHPNAKLTDDDIRVIRGLAAQGMLQRQIAARFGITRPNVGYIVQRLAWQHIH